MSRSTCLRMLVASSVWLGLLLWPFEVVWAHASIGEAASNIFKPTELLTKLLLAASYMLGAILIFMSIAQYKIHRQSPKLTPLTIPVLLLLMGVVCVLIPYTSKIFGNSFSAVEQSKREGRKDKEELLLLPEVKNTEPKVPFSGNRGDNATSDSTSEQDDDNTEDESGGRGGHWTNDPRYN